MPQDHDESRNFLQRAAKKVKDAVADPERRLTNQAAAMPAAAGDLNAAAGASLAGGPSAGFTPGAGAAAAGSRTDEEPVRRADEPEYQPDR